MSWKVKRTVFRDWISIVQPEDDWSLFNLVQAVKQKVYNLPRKVFEAPQKEVKNVQNVNVEKHVSQQPPKEKVQQAAEPQTASQNKKPDETIQQTEEKPPKSPVIQPELIEEEPLEEVQTKEPEIVLPAVTMVPSSDTIGDSSLVKRKPEVSSDRE